jgi:hypothetical protein
VISLKRPTIVELIKIDLFRGIKGYEAKKSKIKYKEY